jgi:signal peptidase I
VSLPSSSTDAAPEPAATGVETGAPVSAETAPAARPSRLRPFIREVIETILLTVLIYALVNYATGRYRVEGDSMQPTMHPDQYVLIDKVSYKLGAPQRGDIVVFEYPFSGSNERDFIKRVIGLPGETVAIANGVVSVNGQPLDEPYIAAPPVNQGTWPLGPEQYFVMGDNRNNSSDSRSWGPLERQYLIGRAVIVYWPPDSWSLVPHYTYVSASSSN